MKTHWFPRNKAGVFWAGYFLGVNVALGGGTLDSHDVTHVDHFGVAQSCWNRCFSLLARRKKPSLFEDSSFHIWVCAGLGEKGFRSLLDFLNQLFPFFVLVCKHVVWSIYSNFTRLHPKWWFSKGNPLISGKSRLVKYYNFPRCCDLFMRETKRKKSVGL